MLRKRSSRAGFFTSSYSSKRQQTPTPKPGRTLVLSSTSASSTLDLGHIVEEGFSFDFEKQKHIEELNSAEPLFVDFYLPSVPDEPLPPPPAVPEVEKKESSASSTRAPSLRWSMETDPSTDSDDDYIDNYCSTPPEGGHIATYITIVYSGRPKTVDLSPTSMSFHRPDLKSLRTSSTQGSRTSSVSTRDFPLSPGPFSDADSKSSPASSISEYSNMVNDTIPEKSKSRNATYSGVNLRPFRLSHRRNQSSSASDYYPSNSKRVTSNVWELPTSCSSSVGHFDSTSYSRRSMESNFTSDELHDTFSV